MSWSSSYSTTRQTGSIAGAPVVNVSAGYTTTLLGPGSLNAQNLAPSTVGALTRDSISLVNNSPTSLSLNAEGNYQTVTFAFTREVYGLTFSIDDIDRAPSYHDHVFLAGAPETPAVTQGAAVTGGGTSTNPWRTTGASGDNAANQTVTVTYPNGLVPITSLTLRFYSTLAPAASALHVVRIRQMQLRTCA